VDLCSDASSHVQCTTQLCYLPPLSPTPTPQPPHTPHPHTTYHHPSRPPQALVHSWLSLKGHSIATCRLAEAWCTATHTTQQRDLQQQEAAALAAAAGQPPPQPPPQDAASLVSSCQSADINSLKPSEILEMVAWAAACTRGDQTQPALAAAEAALAPPKGPQGGLSAALQSSRMASELTAGADKIAPGQLPHLLGALRGHVLTRSVDGAWMQGTYPHWCESLRAIMADSQVARLAAEAAEEGGGGGGEEEAAVDASGGDEQGEGVGDGAGTVEGGGDGSSSSSGSGSAGEAQAGECGGGDQQQHQQQFETELEEAGGPLVVSRPQVEALLAAAAEWCIQRGCVTVGTMSLLRQVGVLGTCMCV